eukprot:714864-Amphidinium_carterae.1
MMMMMMMMMTTTTTTTMMGFEPMPSLGTRVKKGLRLVQQAQKDCTSIGFIALPERGLGGHGKPLNPWGATNLVGLEAIL